MPDNKHFLGDGVFVEFKDGWHFELTTSDGYRTLARIYLEPGMIDMLVEYRDSIYKRSKPVGANG